MCTVPTSIPSSWQFFIARPCSTLIKCFSKHCFQVSWSYAKELNPRCTLRITFVSQYCYRLHILCPYLHQWAQGSHHSRQVALCHCFFFFSVFFLYLAMISKLPQRTTLKLSCLEDVWLWEALYPQLYCLMKNNQKLVLLKLDCINKVSITWETDCMSSRFSST